MKSVFLKVKLSSILMFCANLLAVAFSPFLRVAAKIYKPLSPLILCYHSIDESFSPISIELRLFREHMTYLYAQGFRTLTISELCSYIEKKKPFPEKTVCITFDDGFANILRLGLPIMSQLGFVGTIYIIPSLVGSIVNWTSHEGDLPMLEMLNWNEIKTLLAGGWEIGSHSMSHSFLPLMSEEEVRTDILASKIILEEKLAAKINSFSYPQGALNATVIKIVGDSGFVSACTTFPASLKSESNNLLMLPRVCIGRGQTKHFIRFFVSPLLNPIMTSYNCFTSIILRRHPWYIADPNKTRSSSID